LKLFITAKSGMPGFRPGRLLTLLALLTFVGCATLSSDFEEPSLQINSIRLVNSNTITPRFEIDLHIVNPNRTALELKGLSYTLHVAGHKLVSGASSELPKIAAYGEADALIEANLDLFGGLQLLGQLMNEYQDNLSYEFNAKLDVGSFYPTIPINREGVIDFQ
jgi:LEA14-like dessication related protein